MCKMSDTTLRVVFIYFVLTIAFCLALLYSGGLVCESLVVESDKRIEQIPGGMRNGRM